MNINHSNYKLGNKAMAAVLQLYYQIVKENGLFSSQTVYLNGLDFDPFTYLDIEVDEAYSFEIEQRLLREGSIVYLLIEFNDAINEHDQHYRNSPYIQKIIETHRRRPFNAIPEFADFLAIIETTLDWNAITKIQTLIYQKYILTRFREIANSPTTKSLR